MQSKNILTSSISHPCIYAATSSTIIIEKECIIAARSYSTIAASISIETIYNTITQFTLQYSTEKSKREAKYSTVE